MSTTSRFFEIRISLLVLSVAGNTPKRVIALADSKTSLDFDVVIGNKKKNEIPLIVKPTAAPVRRRSNSFLIACIVSADVNCRSIIPAEPAPFATAEIFWAAAVVVSNMKNNIALNMIALFWQEFDAAKYDYLIKVVK